MEPFKVKPSDKLEADRRLRRVLKKLSLREPPFAAPSFDLHAGHVVGLNFLRLLDFVRSISHSPPRPDLVAELIVNYHAAGGFSRVCGERIEVNPEAFGRVLRLPETPCPHAVVTPCPAVAAAATAAAKKFMEVYILPTFAADEERPSMVVLESNPASVDWRMLIWERVRAEIERLASRQNTDMPCFYGAYLQMLILYRKDRLFRSPRPEPAPEPFVVDLDADDSPALHPQETDALPELAMPDALPALHPQETDALPELAMPDALPALRPQDLSIPKPAALHRYKPNVMYFRRRRTVTPPEASVVDAPVALHPHKVSNAPLSMTELFVVDASPALHPQETHAPPELAMPDALPALRPQDLFMDCPEAGEVQDREAMALAVSGAPSAITVEVPDLLREATAAMSLSKGKHTKVVAAAVPKKKKRNLGGAATRALEKARKLAAEKNLDKDATTEDRQRADSEQAPRQTATDSDPPRQTVSRRQVAAVGCK